jgi:hypothetical protein
MGGSRFAAILLDERRAKVKILIEAREWDQLHKSAARTSRQNHQQRAGRC